MLDWWWRWWATTYQRAEIEKAAATSSNRLMQDIVNGAPVQSAIRAYERDDGRAVFWQWCNRRCGNFISLIAFAGLSTCALSLLGRWLPAMPDNKLAAIQGFILFLLLFAGRILSFGRAEERWMDARTSAETLRSDIFLVITQAPVRDGAKSETMAKFDLIQKGHAEDQLQYFKDKAFANRAVAKRIRYPMIAWIYWLLVLTLGALTASHLIRSFTSIPWPNWLEDLAAAIVTLLDGQFHSLAVLVATCLAAMVRAAEATGLNATNAALFENAERQLLAVVKGPSDVRRSAADGDAVALHTYVEQIQRVLRTAHETWASTRRLSRADDPQVDTGSGS